MTTECTIIWQTITTMTRSTTAGAGVMVGVGDTDGVLGTHGTVRSGVGAILITGRTGV